MAEEAGEEPEARLGAAVGLGLVKGFLVDFCRQSGGALGPAEDEVLAVGEVGLEEVLGDGEGDDEFFPGEEGAVECCC